MLRSLVSRDDIPDEGITVLLFLSTVVTHMGHYQKTRTFLKQD
jgi:hypothetical protein